jgi:hypothetical protein
MLFLGFLFPLKEYIKIIGIIQYFYHKIIFAGLWDESMTLDEFFFGYAESRRIFDALRDMIEALGPVAMRVTKSQIAFRRVKAFAWA